jgi:hypothetical protein
MHARMQVGLLANRFFVWNAEMDITSGKHRRIGATRHQNSHTVDDKLVRVSSDARE